MRLRTASRLFFGTLLAAVLINLGLVVFIHLAQRASEQAVARRDAALHEVSELVHGTDLLASLVQNYTTTGRTRYLDVYYDILGVWQGETAAPERADATAHWREAAAGRHIGASAQARRGDKRSLVERFSALDFTEAELAATRQLLAALAPLQVIEKKAFAATQGLLDRISGEFSDDAQPDPAWASELVHSPEYEARRTELIAAVTALRSQVHERTGSEVAQARGRLRAAVVAAVAVNLPLAALMALALVAVRRQVLRPIEHLADTAGHYAAGHFEHRSAAHGRQVWTTRSPRWPRPSPPSCNSATPRRPKSLPPATPPRAPPAPRPRSWPT
jgi:HAMP domain-containing protein